MVYWSGIIQIYFFQEGWLYLTRFRDWLKIGKIRIYLK